MRKYTLYVVRYSRNDKQTFAVSKPCKHCLKMLNRYGIRKIRYTDADGDLVKTNTQKIHTEHVSMSCKLLLEEGIDKNYVFRA